MKKNDLIENILETEHYYSLEFSASEKTKYGIRYTDRKLPDMHCHNFLRLRRDSEIDFREAVDAEKSFRESEKQEAVQVELFGVDFEAVAKLMGKENLDEHLILYCPLEELDTGRSNSDARAFRAVSEDDLSKGKHVDRLTFGMEYASFSDHRFDRKASSYRDEKSSMNHFVCLAGDEPVGNCDFFIHGEFGKIEDFDVVEKHQRRGYGSAVLEAVRAYAAKRNVKFLFLQVERDNSAVEMYDKLGFRKIFNNIIFNKPVEEI